MSAANGQFSWTSKVTAIVESWKRAWLVFAKLPGATVLADDSMTCLVTGRNDPLLNAVLDSKVGRDQVGVEIEKWIALSRTKAIPVSWHVSVVDDAINPEEQVLLEKGFRIDDTAIGMALDLTSNEDHSSVYDRLEIVDVQSENDFDQWIGVLKNAYPMSEVLADSMKSVFRNPESLGDRENRHFLGVVDGKPAASLTLSYWGGVASIYDVSTSPAFRRRGIARSMTANACHVARKANCALAVLQATHMAESVYRGLGFSQYCLLRQYVLDQPSNA